MKHSLDTNKRDWDTKKVQNLAINAQKLKQAQQDIVNLEQNIEIQKKQTKRNNELKLQQKQIWVQS